MYYFQLLGGLGNQLFQYAAAKALYLETGVPFKVYYEDGNTYADRHYQLEKLNTQAEIAIGQEIPKKTLFEKIKRRLYLSTPFFLEKEGFKYDPSFFKQPLNTHFYGYWQNEAYFRKHRAVLLSDFQPKKPAIEMNSECLYLIEKQSNSIAIHVRRGDYIENPEAYANHGLCELDYYRKAVNFFEETYQQNHYFIFSDDASWAKSNLDFLENKTVIDWNLDQPEEDLRLMSSCKHQIIANSSFSWWGAWLNSNPNKVVIAPKKWTRYQSSQSIVPKEWYIY